VPIVKPRLGADPAANPEVLLPRLPKGFNFCHQRTFSGGRDSGTAAICWRVTSVPTDGRVGSGIFAVWPIKGSPGAQLRTDSRV
jgi:hypothetical protein